MKSMATVVIENNEINRKTLDFFLDEEECNGEVAPKESSKDHSVDDNKGFLLVTVDIKKVDIVDSLKNLSPTKSPNISLKYSKRIAFHLAKKVIEFVHVDDILYLQAEEIITHVFLTNGSKLTAMRNIGFYAKKLIPKDHFYPISSSLLVNIDYVKQYYHSDLLVTLTNGKTVSASRRGGREFRKFLNQ